MEKLIGIVVTAYVIAALGLLLFNSFNLSSFLLGGTILAVVMVVSAIAAS